MTIITKPITEKKLDKLEQPLVQNEINETMSLPSKKDVKIEVPPPLYLSLHSRARRVTSTTTICVFVTAILVFAIGIIGGVYIYYQVAHGKMRHYHGTFHVPLENRHDQPEHLFDYHATFGAHSTENVNNPRSFQQEYEIDPYEKFEKIDVPDFSGGRRGRFIHDFSANKTAIVDLDGRRCFVMPLNRSRVLPPDSLFDLVLKMRAGYYEVDTEVVRESMRVLNTPIKDYSSLGYYIARECSKWPTFKLERMTKPIFKRSIESDRSSSLVFSEFAGSKIARYELIF